MVILCVSVGSSAQVLVSVNFGPPALPVYEQPLCPAGGYVWTPGYWAWSPDGYYWVPGTWVPAPEPDLLWTPGYWAFDDGSYYWHPGYWAPVVGYYGGIAYGYGYPGTGYYGGYWRGRQFYYNQAVNNVNVTNIHNVYNTTVVENTGTVNRVSYNGGPGGTTTRPTPEQDAVARQQHVPPSSAQIQHEDAARSNRNLQASMNHGQPPIAATPKAAEFRGRGVVAASRAGAPYEAPENRAAPSEKGTPPTPRPENRSENSAARGETEPHKTAPHPEVPRPPSASERENVPRPENAPYSQREARPENSQREARPENSQREARPENAPRPRNEPPPNSSTRPDRRAPPDNSPPPPNREDRFQ